MVDGTVSRASTLRRATVAMVWLLLLLLPGSFLILPAVLWRLRRSDRATPTTSLRAWPLVRARAILAGRGLCVRAAVGRRARWSRGRAEVAQASTREGPCSATFW
jgi:hypothetical protein